MSDKKKYKLKQWYPSLPESYKEGKTVLKQFKNTRDIYYPMDGRPGVPAEEVENNPEFWEKVEDKNYKILKVKASPSHPYHGINTFDSHIFQFHSTNKNLDVWDIYSVKRLSDGEVFTVGDKAKSLCDGSLFKIKKIGISDMDDVYFKGEEEHQWNWLYNLNKPEKPLFTTEDGVDIYSGDKFYFVNENWVTMTTRGGDDFIKKNWRAAFSTSENADKYIEENKPRYSKADIKEAIKKSETIKDHSLYIPKLKSVLGL